jgi:hypothetical protein
MSEQKKATRILKLLLFFWGGGELFEYKIKGNGNLDNIRYWNSALNSRVRFSGM